MFAVFKSGGKQHKVAQGDIVIVEKLTGEAGDSVAFGEVLAVGDDKSQTVGAPLVDGATVAGTIVDQSRADKIIVFKKQRRKNYRRRKGHRQFQTVVRIDEILTDGKKPTAKAKAAKAAPKKAETKADAPAKPAEDKAEAKKEPTKAPAKKPAATKAETEKSEAKAPAKKAAAKPAASKKAPAKAKSDDDAKKE